MVVDVRGKEKLMTFLSRLRIPLEHVQGAEADPEIEHTLWRGWRIPGVHVPGVRFYDVHGHREKTIVIRTKDETHDRIIVEVQDPAEVVALEGASTPTRGWTPPSLRTEEPPVEPNPDSVEEYQAISS